MIWNKRKAKSVTLLHEYVHRDIYDTQQLWRVTDDVQLMSENAIHDAFVEAMLHIKCTPIQFFGVTKFCLVYSLPHL